MDKLKTKNGQLFYLRTFLEETLPARSPAFYEMRVRLFVGRMLDHKLLLEFHRWLRKKGLL